MNDLYDVAIVGGGIFGAATARDAALRGLRVILFEKGDVASSTSSTSSKLVHGGIRYLEHFQFRLVRESLVEQERLLRTAPHLVRRRAFLVPDEGNWRRPGWYVQLGLRLYDLLAQRPAALRSRRFSRAEVRLIEPALGALPVRSAGLYFDAQVDDARLTLENLLDASAGGAEVRLETEVAGLVREGSTWRLLVRGGGAPGGGAPGGGAPGGGAPGTAPGAGQPGAAADTESISARCVVNAAGPWVDAVRQLTGPRAAPLLSWSRGAHLLVPAISRQHAFLLTARSDRRVFFIVPQGEVSLVGTTESPHHGALDDLHPTLSELRYLWSELTSRWPDRFRDPNEVRGAFAGVRALVRTAGALGSAPRDERIVDEEGLISVAGGKYTTHRAIAERIVNLVERRLGREPTRCRTRDELLPGAAWGDRAAATNRVEAHLREARAEGRALDWGDRDAKRLAARYGSRFPEVLRLVPEFHERADLRGSTLHEAEVVHAVRVEWGRHLDDVLLRRLGLWRDRSVARRAMEPVSRWMARALQWSEPHRREEMERLERRYRREEQALERLAGGEPDQPPTGGGAHG